MNLKINLCGSAERSGCSIGTSLLMLATMTSVLLAAPGEQVRPIRGNTYEGVIIMPERISGTFPGGAWTPPPNLIREAEAALPAAISATLKRPIRPNLSGYAPAKNATSLNLSTAPRDLAYSEEFDKDFLYSLHPLSQYKRQYLGETDDGVKVLAMHFFYGSDTLTDPFLAGWQRQRIDGEFWRVLYNPTEKSFTNWAYIDLP